MNVFSTAEILIFLFSNLFANYNNNNEGYVKEWCKNLKSNFNIKPNLNVY